MPTYEYHCSACKKNYDLREGFSAEITHPCHECGRGTARRVLHAPSVVFKGSGFYSTDSKHKGKRPAAEKSGDSDSGGTETAPAASGDADSKPMTKPAAVPAKETAAASSGASEAAAS